MADMDDLPKFLRDRLDEDEQTALAASAGPWASHTGPEMKWRSKGELIHPVWTWDRMTGTPVIMTAMWADSQYIAEWHPTRTLREVEAKRRIVECHEPWTAGNGDIICGRCDREHIDGRPGGHFPCTTLRLLATVYADHADYQDAWRP